MNRIKYFRKALIDCRNALANNPKLFPFNSIIDQLEYLIDLEEGQIKDPLGLKWIRIGWIAVRELDGFEDVPLINSLCLVSREVEKMLKERGLYVKKCCS